MCRMIAVASRNPIDIAPYFKALKEQALHGQNSPHGDGWGIALYNDEDFMLKKSAGVIWDAPNFDVKAYMAILHARKSSSPGASVFFSHPFVNDLYGKIWSFAHNGVIKGLTSLSADEIDTQIYSRIFVDELKKSNPVEAMKRTVRRIEFGEFKYTSLNAFVANGSQLYAFRITEKDEDEYHTIFYKDISDVFIFSTEQLGSGWTELKNREYVFVDRTSNKVKIEVGKI